MTADGRERGKKLRDDIYAAYEAAQETRRPRRLRPSAIGHECGRYLWLNLRWADELEMFSGRMLRLFETGHSQEDRLVNDLKRLGTEVQTRDQEDPKKQIGFDLFDGHMAGFIDLAGCNVPHSSQEWVIGECKSSNTKAFAKLVKEGVETAKPEHYAQFQIYLHAFDLPEALYLAVDKNTEELYAEYIQRDQWYIDRLLSKGNGIIFGHGSPPKIHQSGDFYKCKMCSARKVCQEGALPERNCRTCSSCAAIPSDHIQIPADWPHDPETGLPINWVPPKAVWWCDTHQTSLSLERQQAGCEHHRYHRDMVSGVNTHVEMDASGTECPSYRMKDGSPWVDRGPAFDNQRESHSPAPSVTTEAEPASVE